MFLMLNHKQFEKIVAEGIKAIPSKFLDKLSNVAIIVQDEPTTEQKRKLRLRGNAVLLGLYEGVPQNERGSGYTAVLPDKITIFKKSIESLAVDKADLKEIVKNTIWHEVAHHFGMDEGRVHRAEQKKAKNI